MGSLLQQKYMVTYDHQEGLIGVVGDGIECNTYTEVYITVGTVTIDEAISDSETSAGTDDLPADASTSSNQTDSLASSSVLINDERPQASETARFTGALAFLNNYSNEELRWSGAALAFGTLLLIIICAFCARHYVKKRRLEEVHLGKLKDGSGRHRGEFDDKEMQVLKKLSAEVQSKKLPKNKQNGDHIIILNKQ